MFVLFWILVGIFFLLILSGAYVFVKACVRRKELPWMIEEELKKTAYGKYYNCILASDAWLKAHHAQDIYTESSDGLQLHGYWVPVENPRGTILLVHGYRSTMLVDFGLAFAFYHALGMNILVPEQRSHGKSEGKYITFGVKESDDMKQWIAYHNAHFGTHQMILSGMSMGASTVVYLADQSLPFNVKCMIADCGFTSPWDILSKVFRSVTHLPPGIVLWVTDMFARMFADFSLKEKDSRKILTNARLPIFMIHGAADDFVPCQMTKDGYAACTGMKELLIVAGAGHGVSFLKDKLTYTTRVIAFLEKYLEGF